VITSGPHVIILITYNYPDHIHVYLDHNVIILIRYRIIILISLFRQNVRRVSESIRNKLEHVWALKIINLSVYIIILSVWILSEHVKSSVSIDIFKERLKTELFACYRRCTVLPCLWMIVWNYSVFHYLSIIMSRKINKYYYYYLLHI